MANKVLVVDDDVLTQRVLKHYLERGGYQMIGASNGREAIKMAKHEMPRLIILDVMMPDMDGWAVMRQIQKTEATRAIPIILLSGNAEVVATEEAMHSGATQVLVKPINPEQLLGVIKNILPDISEEPYEERS